MDRIAILGSGLIGTSVGLALRAHGFAGSIIGWDRDPKQLEVALDRGAIDEAAGCSEQDGLAAAAKCDLVLLSVPVLAILDWVGKLAPHLNPRQLVTDVGSVKQAVSDLAEPLYGSAAQPGFLPGHPMAGKETFGAAEADASLFNNAVWLFTPFASHPLAGEWRQWVSRFGCRLIEIEAARHDEVCAWVSHLPQMLSTAFSALLVEHFGDSDEFRRIGGRALREMTRLGASPYSMWRDIALTNSDAISAALLALEQELAHLRENLRSPELRREFSAANRLRQHNQP